MTPTPRRGAPAGRRPSAVAQPSAPVRGTGTRRTFAPLPARPTAPDGPFADGPLGAAWLEVLYSLPAADPDRLSRGRRYAAEGRVDTITVTPGRVTAYVHGGRRRPYRAQLTVGTFSAADWERFLHAAAEPNHAAALLDGQISPSLAVGSLSTVGTDGVERPSVGRTDTPLLPAPGDLHPGCSCPDDGHPCKHSAALCFQVARLLDVDAFVLPLVRGSGAKELLDAVARQTTEFGPSTAPSASPQQDSGVSAAAAVASANRAPLPEPPPIPPQPGTPPSYPAAPGAPDPLALDWLATEAATRAHTLLHTGSDPLSELTPWQDAVRLAATCSGAGLNASTRALYRSLAAGTGRSPADIARAVAAWRQGGIQGLAALETPWDPPAGPFDRARSALAAAGLPRLRPHRNHLTDAARGIQLRYGQDARWYPYESDGDKNDWWPTGAAADDPVAVASALLSE